MVMMTMIMILLTMMKILMKRIFPPLGGERCCCGPASGPDHTH